MKMKFIRDGKWYDYEQYVECGEKTEKLGLYSLNVAGYCWRITDARWEDRFRELCAYIARKIALTTTPTLAIGLQEVQLTKGRHLSILKEYFPDFHIVLPKAYNPDTSPRSVISVLLISKEMCDSYSINTLTGLEDNLRYNHVIVNLHSGLCFRLLNVNLPHLCFNNHTAAGYKASRLSQRKAYEESIYQLAKAHQKEQDVKLILFGDVNSTPKSDFMQTLVYSNYMPSFMDALEYESTYTWKNELVHAESRLDYILYSLGMLNDTGISVKTLIDSTTISQRLSDHAMLFGELIFS